MDYIEFLKSKIEIAKDSGFEVSLDEINPILKEHQRDAVQWCVRGGRRALFASFGLGKTVMQLEMLRLILEREGGKALIVCPLGVRQEFKHDAEKLLKIEIEYVKTQEEAEASTASIVITNYERVRDGNINPQYFTATSLDEAAVLRSFGSQTYQEFLKKFKGVKYKFVCTACPSPNKFKELIHYAGYLEVMDTGQALTRFFQRDSTQANSLTLYKHREEEFWLWMTTWSLLIMRPSDLGYSDQGYDLPEMEVIYHEVPVDHLSGPAGMDGQCKLFRDASHGLKEASKEKRDSIGIRVARIHEIIGQHGIFTDGNRIFEQMVIWCDLNDEQKAIEVMLTRMGISFSSVHGSQSPDEKEKLLYKWKNKETTVLLSKLKIFGSGANLQQACKMIYAGIGYKFSDFIQGLHRVFRFGQENPCEIHIIYTESEKAILETLLKKWKQHEHLTGKMTHIIKEYGLSTTSAIDRLARKIGVKRVKVETKLFTAVNNDCVLETSQMPENSIDLIHTSIPFSNHYEYTPSYNDFGHNENNQRFFDQMGYLSDNLLRILKPGRVFACHVKDRVMFGNATGTGMPTIDPFHVDCINHYRDHGFQYFGMITVITDVVRENNQTYRLGWTEQCKDGSKMGVGCPEYILLFRKLSTDTSRAYADVPVSKTKDEYTRAQWQLDAHAFWRSSGDRMVKKDELGSIQISDLQRVYRKFSRDNIYSYEDHVALAKKLDIDGRLPSTFMVVSPGSWTDEVWDDINRMRTLNSEQVRRNVQMHVCPLQLDIVERIINRFSNKGEVVFDPFGGIGTVPMVAIKNGRKGYMTELNSDYFRDAIGYLQAAEQSADMPTLFDLMGITDQIQEAA